MMPLNMTPQGCVVSSPGIGHLGSREVTVPKSYEWKILETFGGVYVI